MPGRNINGSAIPEANIFYYNKKDRLNCDGVGVTNYLALKQRQDT